jgi:hypothetical protein
MKRLLTSLIGIGVLITPALALEPAFLSTTGAATKNADAQGRHWTYLSWSSSRPDQTGGKSYAIYSKPGQPSAPGNFVRQGIVTPVVNATIFAPLLERAEHFGEDIGVLDAMFDDFVDHIDALENAAARPSIARSLPPANKLAAILVKASQHPTLLKGMEDMRAKHPAMGLCLGVAWAGQIMDQVTTYELREFNVAGNADIAVVGRITLDWANPVALPPPGKPVQVMNTKPEGDLNIRLRWSTPDNVRRLGPQVQGYHIWRCTWAYATAHGWDSSAPSIVQLNGAVIAGDVKRVSTAFADIIPGNPTPMPSPVLPSEYLSDTQVNDFFVNPNTYFFADDNRRYQETAPGPAFVDGAEYGYLVTANPLVAQPGEPLLGQGAPSLAGKGTACRTMPPDVPGGLRAQAKFTFANGLGGEHVVVNWLTNTNSKTLVIPPLNPGDPSTTTPTSPTTHYEVLRSTNIADFTSNDGGPTPAAIVVSSLAHTADNAPISFDDVDNSLLTNLAGQTVAYAVRAYRESPCGNIYSAPSPPVFVALRNYKGPDAPTGTVDHHCPAPFAGVPTVTQSSITADGQRHYHVECTRRDEQISAVSFAVFDQTIQQFAPLASKYNLGFAPHQKTVGYDFTFPHGNFNVSVLVRSSNGSISWPAFQDLSGYTDAAKLVKLNFLAGIVDPCGGAHQDPLALFAYGRQFKPDNAVSYSAASVTYVALHPADGLVLDDGALVNVMLEGNGGAFFYLTTATVSSNGIVFVDNGAAGLTLAQLLTRYRCYTLDKSLIQLNSGLLLGNGYHKLGIAPQDVVADETQVCVINATNLNPTSKLHQTTDFTLVGSAEARDNTLLVHESGLPPVNSTYYGFLFLGAMIPGPCPHIPVQGIAPNETIVPPLIDLQPQPGSVEYRIYRRVDDGPLTLMAQGNTEATFGSVKELVRSDDSMPAVNCTIYYYGQTLDKDGNPSPLALLDTIHIGVSSATPLPTPMILPPKLIVSDGGAASLDVTWFSPAAGVDRFELVVVGEKGEPPNPSGLLINATQELFDAKTGEKKVFFFKKAVVTARVGTSPFGSGPAFHWIVPVDSDDTYSVAVKALAPEKFTSEGFSLQACGEFSQAVSLPVPKDPSGTNANPVAWPFRTLPDSISNPFVIAAWLPSLSPGIYGGALGRPSNVGVSFGAVINPTSEGPAALFPEGDPNLGVFTLPGKDASHPAIKSLPVALYRQQIRYSSPNVERPADQQGAILQCSPLISQIAYSVFPPGYPGYSGRSAIVDPAIGIVAYPTGTFGALVPNGNYVLGFFVMDKLPVTKGATYQYWLVHFNVTNEPDRVINAGKVTIPN